MLCYDFLDDKEQNRAIVSLMTCLIIAIPNEEHSLILNNPFIMEFGNISYSIYLIHWPLFVMHRMYRITSYNLNEEPVLWGILLDYKRKNNI